MPKNSEFVNFILEQMAPLGDIRARAMFGGHGIYQGDTMFAIVVDGELYFKADELTRDAYIERGLQPFTYESRRESRRKIVSLHYYATPPEIFDEAEAMQHWARQAIAVALRANRHKPANKRTRPR